MLKSQRRHLRTNAARNRKSSSDQLQRRHIESSHRILVRCRLRCNSALSLLRSIRACKNGMLVCPYCGHWSKTVFYGCPFPLSDKNYKDGREVCYGLNEILTQLTLIDCLSGSASKWNSCLSIYQLVLSRLWVYPLCHCLLFKHKEFL